MLPVCYPSSPSPVTGLPEAVAYALSSVSGLTRWVDYIPVKLVGSPLGLNEQTTNLNGFVPMRLLSSAIGMAAWSDYIPVYVDNSATEAWVTSATGYIPYANSIAGATTPSFYLNLSNPSNATILDGEGRGTITSVRDSVISSSISVSRTSGVAPLYVNFDYTATTSTGSTNATHECFFATDFGDPSSGTWANGVQSSGLTSKNAGYGPVTGHVYETPGTYHPQVTVIDGDGNLSSRTATITVQDPDVVYAGTATICISHSGTFTGAPSGAQQVNTSGNTDMYAAFNTYKASDKRILFCKADNWTVSASMQMTSITGMTVGGYGTGVARAFGFGTLVNVDASAATSGSIFLTTTGCSDIKLSEMKILGGPQSSSGYSLLNTIPQFMAYRMEFRGVSGGPSAYPGGGGTNNVFDEHCIYECVVDDLYGYAGVDLYSASASGAIGTPGIFTAASHSFSLGDKVRLTGTPPTPLATLTDYYISSTSLAANTFTLSSSLDNAIAGTSLALSGTGTCTVGKQALGGGIGAFVGHVRGGMMGCYFDNKNHGEQTVRFPYLDRAHINNNYFARPNQGKNCVKIHSFNYNDVALYSEKFVVFGNVIDMRGGYSYNGTTTTQVGNSAMIIGNGSGSFPYERVRNGIVESNYTQGCLGSPKGTTGAVFAEIGCPNMTIRNNIADFSMGDRSTTYASADAYVGVHMATICTSTPEQTVGVRVYNNTLYSNLSNAELANFTRVSNPGANPVVDTVIVKNNIWYLPYHALGAGTRTAIYSTGSGATSLTATNNTDDNGGLLTSPSFTTQPPVALTDWKPTGYPVNNGVTVPVLRDFNNASRYGSTYDLGAVLP